MNNHVLQALVDKKRKALCAWQNDIANVAKMCAYQAAKAEVQSTSTRKIKTKWWCNKVREIQFLTDKCNTFGFFAPNKAIYGSSRPIRGKQGIILKAGKDINLRWTKHFEEVLNCETPVDKDVFQEFS